MATSGIYLFIYLFTTLFNVGLTILTRLIKTILTKNHNRNLRHAKQEQWIFCTWFNFCLNSLTETLSLTDIGRLFQSKLPRNCTEFIP